MILTLVDVVLPVFLVIAAGYLGARTRLFPSAAIDPLMTFAQGIAVPALLFLAVARLDLGAHFNWPMLVSFYAGATLSFMLGVLGARYLFGRRPGEAVAVGFGALFSNTVLLGLPIAERAYGTDALAPNFAIIAIHAPFCYLLGITVMEFARADGRGLAGTLRAAVRMLAHNALTLAIAAGFVVNLTGLPLPGAAEAALDMLARAALPVALFALGGVLTRYAFSASLGQAVMVSFLSLVVHPGVAWMLGTQVFDLDIAYLRAAVVTAAMAPGVNAFVFSTMYNRAQGTAASSVLLATMVSVFSASAWLWLLG